MQEEGRSPELPLSRAVSQRGVAGCPWLRCVRSPSEAAVFALTQQPLHPEVFWEDEEEEGDNGDNLS